VTLLSSRRPGEDRAAWKRRAIRRRVEAGRGTLAQFVYDQLERKGLVLRRAARAMDGKLPALRQPTEDREE
jgi:hypothetical protein